jgi:exodeoxyribonuclease VII large subunit
VRVRERLAGATGGLDALSPRAVLDRGYAVLLDQSNSVVTSVDDVEVGDALRAMLADGEVSAHVDRKKRGTSWP